MLDQNRELGRHYVDCVNAGALDTTWFSDDFLLHNPAGQTIDLQGSAGALQYFHMAFPDHVTTIDDEIVTENRAIYRWTTRGTHQMDSYGAAASGKMVENTGITILRIEDGKIREAWENSNLLGLMAQIGAITLPSM
jgi:steroid delta-isomerase-like uncharacterized protein